MQSLNLYEPMIATIKSVKELTPTEKMFEVELPDGKRLGHGPGQFVEMTVFGVGEAPIVLLQLMETISISPSARLETSPALSTP